MTQGAVDFVVKIFASAFAAVFVLLSLTLFAAVFVLGDGEAQRILSDMTTPFLGIIGAFVTAFLGHWWFTLRQTDQANVANGAAAAAVAQATRYDDRLMAATQPEVSGHPSTSHGPLSSRVAAQAAQMTQMAQAAQGLTPPAPQVAGEESDANGH